MKYFALLLFVVPLLAGETEGLRPLTRAHAHNDYEHTRPLWDALDRGFGSVEADIWLTGDQLLLAHDKAQIKPERTLEALYLDPLRDLARKNGGHVFPNGPSETLLIDVKSDARETYQRLRTVLERYAGVLTRFEGDKVFTNAITVIISGNRAPELLAAESVRYAGIDGRLEDLKKSSSASLIPLVSESWGARFHWKGSGPIPPDEHDLLVQLAGQAHQQGRRIRFWGTPDRVEFWEALYPAGVDLLNADDLAGLQAFLLKQAHP